MVKTYIHGGDKREGMCIYWGNIINRFATTAVSKNFGNCYTKIHFYRLLVIFDPKHFYIIIVYYANICSYTINFIK